MTTTLKSQKASKEPQDISYNIPLSQIEYIPVTQLKNLKTLDTLDLSRKHLYTRQKPTPQAVTKMKQALRIIVGDTIYYRVVSPFVLWKQPKTGDIFLVHGYTRTQALIELQEDPLVVLQAENSNSLYEASLDTGFSQEAKEDIRIAIETNQSQMKKMSVVFEDVPVQFLEVDTTPPASLLLWLQKSLNNTTTKEPVVAQARSVDEEWHHVYEEKKKSGLLDRHAQREASDACSKLMGLTLTELSWLRSLVRDTPAIALELLDKDLIKMRTVISARQRYDAATYIDKSRITLERAFQELLIRMEGDVRIKQSDVDSYFQGLQKSFKAQNDNVEEEDREKQEQGEEEKPQNIGAYTQKIFDELNTASAMAVSRERLGKQNLSNSVSYLKALHNVSEIFLSLIDSKNIPDSTADHLNELATCHEELMRTLADTSFISQVFLDTKFSQKVCDKIEKVKMENSKLAFSLNNV